MMWGIYQTWPLKVGSELFCEGEVKRVQLDYSDLHLNLKRFLEHMAFMTSKANLTQTQPDWMINKQQDVHTITAHFFFKFYWVPFVCLAFTFISSLGRRNLPTSDHQQIICSRWPWYLGFVLAPMVNAHSFRVEYVGVVDVLMANLQSIRLHFDRQFFVTRIPKNECEHCMIVWEAKRFQCRIQIMILMLFQHWDPYQSLWTSNSQGSQGCSSNFFWSST